MKDNIKVLLVSPIGENLTGGIISWTKYIVDYSKKSGKGVELRLLDSAGKEQLLGSDGLLKRVRVGVRSYLPLYKQFKKEIQEKHYDKVHICTSASLGLIRDLLLVRVAKKHNVKTIVHMHFGRIPVLLKSKGWESKLLRRLLKIVDCVVVMDRTSLCILKEEGYEKVKFLPNPLSTEVFRMIESDEEGEREQRKIVFAGHVLETKGVFELVEACRDIHNVKLVILGKLADNTMKTKLYSLGGESSYKWLSIPGNKRHEEVIKEMKCCEVFVLPSYSEGFPNVILEAMACGTPIVATSVGAIPEMLNIGSENPCGICVPPKNAGELRRAILELLSDRKEEDFLGKNARLRVNEKYSLPNVWMQLVEVWREL